MAKRTKYKEACHKRAFELYRELGSFYAVSKEKGMPSHPTLLQWAKASFNCKCNFHGWDELQKQIREEVRKRFESEEDKSDLQGLQDLQIPLEKYIRPDLEKLQINRLAEKKAFDAIKEGRAIDPETLIDAVKLIHSLWREDRVIMGEPGEITEIRGPLVIIEEKDADSDKEGS